MTNFQKTKSELLSIGESLSGLISEISSLREMAGQSFEDWNRSLAGIRKQLLEDVIRVAVVGAIKSGKSTFVNAMLKDDFLKRGAGVVTSIVTRIRGGKHLRARLYFKSWDEVNADIEQAMVLFPAMERPAEGERFDIRRQKDRAELEKALTRLGSEHLIRNDSRDANSVLLSSYLQGFDRVKEMVGPEPTRHDFTKERFSDHRHYVGNEMLAVYLKDIEVEIDSPDIDPNIEIADCQGSDSPNPIHLSMIQDYLMLAHLLVYVVSSRTGLRQADIKFLSIISRMGILDNILFVVNCDFSEHESLEDMKRIVGRVREEISLIRPDPEVFALSALFNLFDSRDQGLSEKEQIRLQQWQQESDLVEFSSSETERFFQTFGQKLTDERLSLFTKNNLERLRVIADGLYRWVRIHSDVLSQDASGAAEMVHRIKTHQERVDAIKTMIKSTLGGALGKLKEELRTDLDRFFDPSYGKLLGGAFDFIRNYEPSLGAYEKSLETVGFTPTLYLLFQDFRQVLNSYLAETVNPEVVRFIRGTEKKIRSYLESVAGPFRGMIQDALVDFDSSLERFGVRAGEKDRSPLELADMETIRNVAGISLPPAVAHLRYSARIRTEAIMRFGFYRVVRAMKKLLKKPLGGDRQEGLQALRDGMRRIKRETERSLRFHFKDYRENIKFQYLFRLVDAASNTMYERLLDEFQAYMSDLSRMAELVSRERSAREETVQALRRLETQAETLAGQIAKVRSTLTPSSDAYDRSREAVQA